MTPASLDATDDGSASNVTHVGVIARGGGAALLALVASAAVQYLYNVLVARTFGAPTLGRFTFSFGLVAVASTLGQAGFRETLVRYVASYRAKGHHGHLRGLIAVSLGIGVLASAALAGALYFLAPFIAHASHKPQIVDVVRTLVWAVPLLTLGSLAAAALQGVRRIGQASLVRQLGRALAGLGAISLCWISSFTFDVFLYAYIFCLVLVVGCGAILVELGLFRDAAPVDRQYLILEWSRFALPVVMLDLFRTTSSWLDTILLGFFAVASDVAVYYAALRTAIVMTIVLASFNAVLLPLVAELWTRRDTDGLAQVYRTTTRWTWALTLPLALILVLCSRQLMALFGQAFAGEGAIVLVIIVSGRLVNAMTGGVAQILLMTGHQRLEAWNTLSAMVAMVVGLFFVVPEYGIVGAAIVNAMVVIFMNILKLVEVRLLLGISPYNRSYLKVLVAGAFASAACGPLVYYANALLWWVYMGSTVLLVVVAYVGAMCAMGLEEEDHSLAQRLRDKFRCRLGGCAGTAP